VQGATLSTTSLALPLVYQEALTARYAEAVTEVNRIRGGRLTSGFYAQNGQAVLNAGLIALDDHYTSTKRLHTLSAPAGAGKTSFSYALITAVTRAAEDDPKAPYGCLFVVDQITQADGVYRELSQLLPGRVAIWTKEHDPRCQPKDRERLNEAGLTPAAQFDKADLRRYPVAVVTHSFLLDRNSYNAVDVVRDGVFNPGGKRRALMLIDEQPRTSVGVLDVQLSQAQAVREKLLERYPQAKEPMNNLLQFMEKYPYVQSNKLFRPGLEINDDIREKLLWFGTREAEDILRSVAADKSFTLKSEDDDSNASTAARVFRYAHLLGLGFGLVACANNSVHFCAWHNRLADKLEPGTILLDATADIDGVSKIVPWMVPVETPQATYGNLEIVHVPKLTHQNLKSYLSTATGLRTYQQWMIGIILDNTKPGQKVLVVCKKDMIKHEYIPNWPRGDERFRNPKAFTTEYGWQLEGRNICVTHWGNGVGSNDWENAEVVILCDEYYLPRSVAVAHTQGHREHKAYEGDLATMNTLDSSAPNVDGIANGHLLRHFKQMALRGNARHYDEHGACGKQRLVIACELSRLLANAELLFPGAPVHFSASEGTLAERALGFLNALPESITTTAATAVGDGIGREWKSVSRKLLTSPAFCRSLETIGWRYVAVKGRNGSRFERKRADAARLNQISEGRAELDKAA
jgi:hypothetical protein